MLRDIVFNYILFHISLVKEQTTKIAECPRTTDCHFFSWAPNDNDAVGVQLGYAGTEMYAAFNSRAPLGTWRCSHSRGGRGTEIWCWALRHKFIEWKREYTQRFSSCLVWTRYLNKQELPTFLTRSLPHSSLAKCGQLPWRSLPCMGWHWPIIVAELLPCLVDATLPHSFWETASLCGE